jgi:hypothetical protein
MRMKVLTSKGMQRLNALKYAMCLNHNEHSPVTTLLCGPRCPHLYESGLEDSKVPLRSKFFVSFLKTLPISSDLNMLQNSLCVCARVRGQCRAFNPGLVQLLYH